jgi:hypothetical protein
MVKYNCLSIGTYNSCFCGFDSIVLFPRIQGTQLLFSNDYSHVDVDGPVSVCFMPVDVAELVFVPALEFDGKIYHDHNQGFSAFFSIPPGQR